MKIQRHPGSPNQLTPSSNPEIGSPTMFEIGIAAMNPATALARSAGRNHSDR